MKRSESLEVQSSSARIKPVGGLSAKCDPSDTFETDHYYELTGSSESNVVFVSNAPVKETPTQLKTLGLGLKEITSSIDPDQNQPDCISSTNDPNQIYAVYGFKAMIEEKLRSARDKGETIEDSSLPMVGNYCDEQLKKVGTPRSFAKVICPEIVWK
ncbi:MAG: hypothetical protein KDD25_01935 [Bdellovibrionales bacterium]|nr:hypothetical protein [Bdellovibrionales bacterium]